jgi:methionyl-tRNA formyltransferase
MIFLSSSLTYFTSFRGPAPLHHTLLAGETHTGVTLQTLHPEKFDHGAILAQTPPLKIPNASQCTYQELLEFITPKAAEVLVQGIRDRLFIPDRNRQERSQHNDSGRGMSSSSSSETGRPLRHAPKITTEDRYIDWKKSTEDILRRDRVLGRLWTFCQPKGRPKTRIVLEGLEDMTRKAPDFWWFEMLNELASTAYSKTTGNMNNPYDHKDLGKFILLPVLSVGNQRFSIPFVEQGGAMVMRHPNGDVLLVKEITIEGGKKKSAAKALAEWSRAHEVAVDESSYDWNQ